MESRQCPICEGLFEPNAHNQRYCGPDCKQEAKNASRRSYVADVAAAVAPLYEDDDDGSARMDYLRKENQRLSRELLKWKLATTEVVNAVYSAVRDSIPKIEFSPVPVFRASQASSHHEEIAVVPFADFQCGKALWDETPVFTTDGWKMHGEIKPGDMVYSPTGKPVEVISVTGSTIQPCYKVVFDDDSTIIASGDHLWQGYRRYKDYPTNIYRKRPFIWTTNQIASISKVLVRGEEKFDRAFHVDLTKPLSFDNNEELPYDPYVIGAWLGDGLSESGRICVGDEDLEHFSFYGDMIKYPSSGVHMLKPPKLIRAIKELGMFRNKHVPDCYLYSSEENRLSLLQGLMDTDGYINEKGFCEFSNTNQQVAESVLWLVRSLGGRGKIHIKRGILYGVEKRMVYRVFFTPLFNPFRLPRKANRFKELESNSPARYKFVQNVEYVGDFSAQCLTVEGNLYLAGHELTVTHNCTPTYNVKILEQRIEAYAEKVIKITNIQRADHPVNHLRLWLLGDIVEGEEIFPSQSHLLDASLYEQVAVAGPRILGNFLRTMLAHFETIHVTGVIGNHGRLSRDHNSETNFDRILYQILAQIFANEPRITFNIPDGYGERSFYAIDTIGNYSTLLIHGDQFNSCNSSFIFSKKILGWRTGAIPQHFDAVYCGHWHQSMKLSFGNIEFRISPSPESYNTFAQEFVASMNRPAQNLMFVHPNHGITSEYTIWLD